MKAGNGALAAMNEWLENLKKIPEVGVNQTKSVGMQDMLGKFAL